MDNLWNLWTIYPLVNSQLDPGRELSGLETTVKPLKISDFQGQTVYLPEVILEVDHG